MYLLYVYSILLQILHVDCVVLILAGIGHILDSSRCATVFWLCNQTSAGNTVTTWLLLSGAYTPPEGYLKLNCVRTGGSLWGLPLLRDWLAGYQLACGEQLGFLFLGGGFVLFYYYFFFCFLVSFFYLLNCLHLNPLFSLVLSWFVGMLEI